MRFRAFSLLFVVFFNILLAAREQAQKKDAPPGWVFAHAQYETQLVSVGSNLDEEAASSLTWAVCEAIVTRVTMAAHTRTRDAYQYHAAESMPVGTYCLL